MALLPMEKMTLIAHAEAAAALKPFSSWAGEVISATCPTTLACAPESLARLEERLTAVLVWRSSPLRRQQTICAPSPDAGQRKYLPLPKRISYRQNPAFADDMAALSAAPAAARPRASCPTRPSSPCKSWARAGIRSACWLSCRQPGKVTRSVRIMRKRLF